MTDEANAGGAAHDATVQTRATGLLLPEDNPASKAAYADPRNWPMELLMADVPYQAPPAEFLVPGLRSTSYDQDGKPACVAFHGTHVMDTFQQADIGQHPYTNSDCFRAYDRLKHGWGTWPGDGIPDAPGSYPQAYWEMARRVGVEDHDGKVWKISAWYSHDFRGPSDLEFVQQVLMTFGPVSWGTPWPGNWFSPPKASNGWKMPPPGAASSSHAYSTVGWKTDGSGVWLAHVNSWGFWGHPQGLFYTLADWFYGRPLGPQVVHKVVDYDDVPDPPAPPPPGGDTVKAYDAQPRTLDCAIGTQFYRADGVTPLVKLSSGGTGLYSPCKWDSSNYNVRISTGGVAQLAVVRATDCSNVKDLVSTDCSDEVAAEHKRWTDWLASAPE